MVFNTNITLPNKLGACNFHIEQTFFFFFIKDRKKVNIKPTLLIFNILILLFNAK